MTATMTAPFSEYNREVKDLVQKHTELADIDLWLALRYQSELLPGDIFLFEVIDGFGLGLVDSKKKLFKIAYESDDDFPIAAGKQLHMVLTSPEEFAVAFEQGWEMAEEIRQAVRTGKYEALFCNAEGEKMLETLRE